MVHTPSNAAQTSEVEKRRKQTMAKVKAHHFSRQLQMRLQYARLKVEHGWQKQNLNEVENLYFRHSHLRGPKPVAMSSLVTTQQQSTIFPDSPSQATHSSLSFKVGSSNLTRSTISISSMPSSDPLVDHIPPDPSILVIADVSSHSNSESIASASATAPSSSTGVDRPPRSPHTDMPSSILVQSLPAPREGEPAANLTCTAPSGQLNNSATAPDTTSILDSSSTAIPYSPGKASRLRAQKFAPIPKALTSNEMLNFGVSTQTSLTYDSFWTFHANSTPAVPKLSGTSSTTRPTHSLMFSSHPHPPANAGAGGSSAGVSSSTSVSFTSSDKPRTPNLT